MDCAKQSPLDEGEIELDESYFVEKRVREKCQRGASGKIPVFGIFKRNGESVYSSYKELFIERNIIYNLNNNIYWNACIY